VKQYNPKRKHFIYSVQRTAIGPATGIVPIRTNIHSDSWFEMRAIQGYVVFAAGGAPTLDNITVNLYDEGTGRQVFSAPMTFDALVPQLNYLAATAASLGMIPHIPFYLPVPYLLRPSTVLRTEIVNNNAGGTGPATVRIAYIGQKIFDLLTPYQKPGTQFLPFSYVADFTNGVAGIPATTQLTVTVPIQSDYDFALVKVTASNPLLRTALDGLFMQTSDLRGAYAFEDAQIPLPLVAGAPHWPFLPIDPIMFQRGGGVNITINNTTLAAVNNGMIVLHGYKIVG
jgi:hypothetical protein